MQKFSKILFVAIIFFLFNVFLIHSVYARGTCLCCNHEGNIQDNRTACENYCSGKGGIASWWETGGTEERGPCATPSSAGTSPTKPKAVELESPIAAQSVPELIGTVIKTILGIVGALALLMFVYGGFTWLTSGGSPDKIKKGRDILMWATIGLAVIFASYTLVDFVIRTITGT